MPRKEVNLQQVAHEVVTTLAALIRQANATVEIGELPTVQGDRTTLSQVLQNLIANAIKFRSDRDPVIRIWSLREDKAWQITVEDNGIGIPPKYHREVFHPLRRLHSQDDYEGTGLGLATCMKIIERHSGSISVESEEGLGSRFRFTLPAT